MNNTMSKDRIHLPKTSEVLAKMPKHCREYRFYNVSGDGKITVAMSRSTE